jgi:predicted negative regulator of RcsB-dependent stress response
MKRYRLINNVLGWCTFLIAAYTYLMTIEPTASFWDCGEFITSAYKLEVGHPPGAPFFMLTGNLFTQLTPDASSVAKMVNAMSALFSALTILFLFWSITHIARRIILKDGKKELTPARTVMVMGCGLVGALAYTFSDTFWFSAVEGEVYAYSSLFTAVVFWLILKWENVADQPHADRWIVLIAYFMGLSIGVHLLNLLCIPAIVLVYYYKKFPNPTTKGALIAIGISFVIIALMMYGVVQGLVEVCGWFELLFVNVLGMPYNSGVFVYVIAIAGVLGWAIWETMRTEVNPLRMKIAFILSITLLGIPFIGNRNELGILFILALTAGIFYFKNINIKALNTTLVSLMVIVVGYSCYALILIRSTADTPMNQNKPSDIFTLRTYLAREQYGDTPLVHGRTYVSDIKREKDGSPATENDTPVWSRAIKKDPNQKDEYIVTNHIPDIQYTDETQMLFPRMHSPEPRHVEAYKAWANVKGRTVRYKQGGETVSVVMPTFAENLRFFFSYQLNFMYWRYFMWNFSGRQNDIQGHGEILNGNAITGIRFIDAHFLGPQDDMPYDITNNKGHNVYYMLPLLLGILGILYQIFSGKKGAQSFLITFFLFFMTGIAIVLYLNQTPYQPRERDYAYAGSFYAFCIWIGLGVGAIARGLEKYAKAPAIIAASVATLLCLFIPFRMASQNWDDHDRSGRHVARDFGANYLESCEKDAIIFTNGDNDTFPLWYAQEVEGIRTDVRVCNTSYLQTDWYINQMKRQAYESDPLPITWTYDQYIQGQRDHAYVLKRVDGAVDLGQALEWIRSDDPRHKRLPNISQGLDHIPSDKLVFKVDSAAVMRNHAINPVDAPLMLKEMTIDLSDRTVIGKEAITILDMLYTNNWERPIYYAITVDPRQFVKLDNYFQKTGLGYRIVPFNARQSGSRAIDTEVMYDNVMNKFKWGGMDKPGVYIDENTMRMCKSYRNAVFGELASALIQENKNEKAISVLDKAMQVLPPENIPYDYSAFMLGELYLRLGEKDKGEQILNGIAENSMRSIRWFFRLSPDKLAGVSYELQQQLYIMQNVLSVGIQNNPDFGKAYRDEYNNYRMAYQQQAQPANQ